MKRPSTASPRAPPTQRPSTSPGLYNRAIDDDSGLDISLNAPKPTEKRHYAIIAAAQHVLKAHAPKKLPPPPHQSASPRTRLVAEQLAKKTTDLRRDHLGAVTVEIAKAVEASRAQPMASPKHAQKPAVARLLGARVPMQAIKAQRLKVSDATPGAGAWRENKSEQRKRQDQLLGSELSKTDNYISMRKGELNALVEYRQDTQAELEMLESELALLKQEHSLYNGDYEEQLNKHAALDGMVESALDEAFNESHVTESYVMMQERYVQRRPHLERKLAYLRSLHIELRERLKTQQEAAETAQAAQGRMDNRHEVALAAFKAQLEEHTATREAMKAELLKMGSAKRRALATDKALDADRLKMLQNVMEEDHAEMVKFTEAQENVATKKANAKYEKENKKIDARTAPAKAAAALAKSAEGAKEEEEEKNLFGGRKMGKREAWVRLCFLTDVDSESMDVQSVLEYWEDKEETRQALENVETERAEKVEDNNRLLKRLEEEHLAARDENESARKAFDALLDEANERIKAVERVSRKWQKRLEKVEGLTGDAFSQLGRAVQMLTSRSVLHRMNPDNKGKSERLGKQVEEVDSALSKVEVWKAQLEEREQEDLANEAAAAAAAAAFEAGMVEGGEGFEGGPPAFAEEEYEEGDDRDGTPRGGRINANRGGEAVVMNADGEGAVAASNISMAVANILGISGEGARVSESQLRAAKSDLLCDATGDILEILMGKEVLKMTREEKANKRPEYAPQLEGDWASGLNMRMPSRLPRSELFSVMPNKEGKLPERGGSLSPQMRRGPSGAESPALIGVLAEGPAAAPAAANAPAAEKPVEAPPERRDSGPSIHTQSLIRVKVIDPITLAGQADVEAEEEAASKVKLTAEQAVAKKADAEEEATADGRFRMEVKRREYEVLVQKRGIEEATKLLGSLSTEKLQIGDKKKKDKDGGEGDGKKKKLDFSKPSTGAAPSTSNVMVGAPSAPSAAKAPGASRPVSARFAEGQKGGTGKRGQAPQSARLRNRRPTGVPPGGETGGPSPSRPTTAPNTAARTATTSPGRRSSFSGQGAAAPGSASRGRRASFSGGS